MPEPFVGRQTELDQLRQALHSAFRTRKPKFVLIQGQIGVGKTALVKHFLAEQLAQNPSILIGEGKCAMETETNGLIPFRQILIDLYSQANQTRIVFGSLWEFTKEVAPAWLDIITAGAVTATLNTMEAGGKLLGHGTFSQGQVFIQFANALSQLAKTQLSIVFIDDLHWADASSLRMLFHLARHLEDSPALFVCTYRPVVEDTGNNAELLLEIRANLIRDGAIELELRQGIDVAEYVSQRYPSNTFTDDFIVKIQELTDGHALFMSQLFSLWQDKGTISSVPTPDGRMVWVLAKDAQISITLPQALTEVFEERLHRMEDELREMLVCAAVEGEAFTAQVIARLRGLDELKVIDDLETLEHRYHVIHEEVSRDIGLVIIDFYRFVHRFFREHIHNHMSEGKRRILHRQVGECLEVIYLEDLPGIAGQLAEHFQIARESLKAAKYSLMAAQFEQSRYAWAEAEMWCEFGLELVNRLPSSTEVQKLKVDLLEQSAEGYWGAGNHSQARDRCETALSLAQRYTGPERIATLYALLTDIADAEGKIEDALQYVTQARDVLSDLEVPSGELQARLDVLYGMVQIRTGKNHLAVQSLRQVLADVEKLPESRTRDLIAARAYDWLGIALGYLNDYAGATTAYQRAIEIAKAIDEKWQLAISQLNLAVELFDQDKLDESEELILDALKVAQQIGDSDSEAYARLMSGNILLARGRAPDSIKELQRVVALIEKTGGTWQATDVFSGLALANLALSNLDAAYQQALRSLSEAEKTSQALDLGVAYAALAQVDTAQQRWESATQHFMQAIGNYQQAESPLYVAQTQRHFAEALLKQQGEQQRAAELLRDALEVFRKLGLTQQIVATQHILDACGMGSE